MVISVDIPQDYGVALLTGTPEREYVLRLVDTVPRGWEWS